MIMTNNMLYSHSRPDQNGKLLKKFNFAEKGIIKVRYDKERVSFICSFLEETLNVDMKAGEHVHFGVYLYNTED